jgi:abortive infection bacteriophage resistance protein
MPLHIHWVVSDHSCTRIYSGLAILAHFIKQLHPASSWLDKMENHVATFPDLKNENVSISNAGFPHSWQTMPLWNR